MLGFGPFNDPGIGFIFQPSVFIGKEIPVQGIGHRFFLGSRGVKIQLAYRRKRQCKKQGKNESSHTF